MSENIDFEKLFDEAINKNKKKSKDEKIFKFLSDVKDKIADLIEKRYKIEEIRKILNMVLNEVRDKYGIKQKNAITTSRLKKFINTNIKQKTERKTERKTTSASATQTSADKRKVITEKLDGLSNLQSDD